MFQETTSLINAQLSLKPPSPLAEGEPEGGVKSTCSKEARPWRKIKSHFWREESLLEGKSPRYNSQL